MKRFITLCSILLLSVFFTGCGLFSKYTLRDFMCGMDEGHIDFTENGGIRAAIDGYTDPTELNPDVLMVCDFECINGYYYIYWNKPDVILDLEEEKHGYMGFVHIPEDIEIHNREKNIYNLTYQEIRYIGDLTDTYVLHGHDTLYNCIDALNEILDDTDYIEYMLQYNYYCEKHDKFYDKAAYCIYCKIEESL